ncbi:MAG: NAD(P)/FAD-dependent oxidoreductase [Candidatus Thiodiazotropha sp.]
MAGKRTVAIIGAGMAGLAAAKKLCSEGFEVRLFEANSKVGGCCAHTHIGGYTLNDGAVYLTMPKMLDYLFEALRLDRTSLLPLKAISHMQSATLPDGTIVDIASGPSVTVHSPQGVAETALAQSEVTAFLSEWESIVRLFTDDILVHPLSLSHLIVKSMRHFAKLRGTAAWQLKRSFTSEAVRAAFGGALLYAGVPPDKMPAASLLGLAAMLRDGYFLPTEGMGRIPEVFSEAIQAQGGSLHLNSAIQRILVRNGRAYAVDVAEEGVVEVDAVISSVSAMHTYGALLSETDVPSRMMRKVRRSPMSYRGFVLQLGLRNKIEARSHINCVIPWLDDQSQIFQTAGDDVRWLTYTIPTVTLPKLAPDGCSIVDAFPSIRQDIVPEEWNEDRKKTVVAKTLEMLRREYSIDLATYRVLSPKEFQDSLHLYSGAMYGLSPAAGPAALFKYRTPIRGLYQAGQTTWPGFGVVGAGMSGIFAAETLIHDMYD